jgi:aminoglycoside/choline kinase family phosphotransferase
VQRELLDGGPAHPFPPGPAGGEGKPDSLDADASAGSASAAITPTLPPGEAHMQRRAACAAFLARHGWGDAAPVLLAGDASFRTYYRLRDGRRRAVLMDAPPPHEDVAPFVAVSAMLRGLGLSAPEIFAADHDGGFLLVEDFGDDTYTRLLADGGEEASLYGLAIDALVALQRAVAARGHPDLPPYDEARLLAEAALLIDWYVPAMSGTALAETARAAYFAAWRDVLPHALLSSRTLVLRDYHVDNLMRLPDRPGVRGCGLLDFQDAVLGPPSYDLVSLLEDARRDVTPGVRDAMIERYLAGFPALDRTAFRRSAAVLAAQRNCKIVGIFTRLWRRDGKPDYLAHIPRVWRLLEDDVRDPALAPIARWLDRHIRPELRQIPSVAGG